VLQTEWTKQYIIILTNKLPLASPTNEHILLHLINDLSLFQIVCPVLISFGQVYVVYLKKKYICIAGPLAGGPDFFQRGGRPPTLAPALQECTLLSVK